MSGNNNDARDFARKLAILDESPHAKYSDAYFTEAASLITADRERVKMEERERCAGAAVSYCEFDNEIEGWTQAESGYLRAAIMGTEATP